MINADAIQRESSGQVVAAVRPVPESATAGEDQVEMLAVLGHELRHPLAVIRNAVGLLRQKGEDAPTREWVGGLLERQTQRLGRLIDDLLDVSRIGHGKLALDKQPVDLGECVARAVETASPEIEARGHRLEISLPREPVFLKADSLRLEQVLINLLTNAAKYTDPGGHIGLMVERIGREVVLRVRDTGIGIAAETLPHVFDLFWQSESSLDHSHGGMGIGLALVRRLVEMHGGSVSASSLGSGQGSEFVVCLPASAEVMPEVSERAPVRPATPPARVLRVLIVDDDPDIAAGLARLLRVRGHDVETVADGPTALDRAESVRPDVVLLDISLPGMDGCEVARRLRRQAGGATALLVAVTGYGSDEDRSLCCEAGFDMHLLKPLEPEELQELLADQAATAAHPQRHDP